MSGDRRTIRKTDWIFRGLVILMGSGVITMGWYVRDFVDNKLAAAEEVNKLQAQVGYLLDSQNDWLVGQIAYLERKDGKNADDRERLDRFRQRLATLRVIRNGNGQ